MTWIDLRSDTVTRPTREMRRVMAEAEVGDDVFGEDPTVNRLQEMVADLLGTEAALFVPSGTMGNQLGIHCHTRPGDEIICEAGSHFLHFESGAMAALNGVQARPLVGERGVITARQIEDALRGEAHYFPRSRLIALENTHNTAGGTIFPLAEIQQIRQLADKHGLAMHLDGARLWNACAATGISPREYARYFDSVSVCFSKGLGAPIGSAVAGAKDFVMEARRFRKMFGGGMRQVGIIAAAAIYALEHHRERLVEDHANARRLAEALHGHGGMHIDLATVQTNIVIIDIANTKYTVAAALEALKKEGVLVVPFSTVTLRAVTHLDVNAADIERAIAIFHRVFSRS
ncbi:MAG: aminotransferase class I/II-fold pyridoxal phosphate-dependent enzyme [candidate division KSB1 bacterium]|nr:aminotransferase class I/II-fold pyridoxal phosphate-dependent enzyme [candidate division KSB1 bacterium]MDZ7301439.1 aminotransferase class I/II-fold pyridoxal phosphate-dependent enzyme [candidate division KSB1 bacterium]MDZ7313471.1 aminotransferase class I/II-fold pyridoxal phosphate-dependent enzyme [candidate division KSB1 bacterium]